MSENRPAGRQKHITGTGSGAEKHGQGLGTGPVGAGRGSSGSSSGGGSRPTAGGSGSFSGGRPSGFGGGRRSTGSGGGGFNPLIILLVVLLLGGGGLSGIFGGGNNSSQDYGQQVYVETATATPRVTARPTEAPRVTATPKATSKKTTKPTATPKATAKKTAKPTATPKATAKPSGYGGNSWYSLFSGASGSVASGAGTDSTALNREVAPGSREKYTRLKGSGKDTVTLMIYMCGTDLESRSGMASRDLQEITKASYGDNVQVIVYTGGCSSWHVQGISSSVNQIYRVASGKLQRLVDNDGSDAMTNPATLTRFIKYCASNYPASRNMLIFWDHGGGSVSGYGYDEKYKSSGAMSLAGINTALKNAGVKFDIIGFDACLMATVETALVCAEYGDYLIASEESEPGIGWYYTDWLTALGRDTSIDTLDLGKMICDGFTSACASQCRGQDTTLSVIDLAEVQHTVPEALTAWSRSVSDQIAAKDYNTISNARAGSREFASSSRIDQVDLTDLALKTGTEEGENLANTLRSAVKYNRSTMSNAYGVSVYFPYQKTSTVNKAVSTYNAIGLDESYSDCIRAFASVQSSGQTAMGGSHSPYYSLSGGATGAYGVGDDDLTSLLSVLLGGGSSSSSMDFLFGGRAISNEDIISLVTDNRISDSMRFSLNDAGDVVLAMSERDWSLVHSVDRNLFIDDGEGYIDLGLDNTFSWDQDGNLVIDMQRTWLAIDGQLVPYYHLYDKEDSTVVGYIPALLNGERVRLLVFFDSEGYGSVVGAQTDYREGETDTVAKNITELADGDEIILLCDYYTYSGVYDDSYRMGRPLTVSGPMAVSDVWLPEGQKALVTYRLTDVYNQAYWTESLAAE
ncbi:MAG: peptidase C11 [Clostridia bacterium]|nr:peptidase C11 [Clostridia bacterium]